MHPDDRVLVAIMNNQRDWALVQDEGWYRLPVKHAPPGAPDFGWLAFYFTKIFKDDKWAIHYYAPIQGHELVARRDLIPSEPDHPRAGNWYYALQLGPLEHKLPPIVSHRWRRVTHHHHQRRPLHERVQARSTTSSSRRARPVSYT